MTKEELICELARQAETAEVMQATAPVGAVLRAVLLRLDQLELNGGAVEHTEQPDRMLRANEAAARLGVSPRWLYARADSLPFSRRYPGGQVRFSVAGLDRWLSKRR